MVCMSPPPVIKRCGLLGELGRDRAAGAPRGGAAGLLGRCRHTAVQFLR